MFTEASGKARTRKGTEQVCPRGEKQKGGEPKSGGVGKGFSRSNQPSKGAVKKKKGALEIEKPLGDCQSNRKNIDKPVAKEPWPDPLEDAQAKEGIGRGQTPCPKETGGQKKKGKKESGGVLPEVTPGKG